uniref:Uncharacterized protein n=1 Tax=Thermofilum pendens TaxID=2269 RepID=A0A7C4FFI0_THEPE
MKRSRAREYACGDFYVRLSEEGDAYCVEYSEQLEEHCPHVVLMLRERCMSREELAQRFGDVEGLVEELTSRCPELARRASLRSTADSLRLQGWVVHAGKDLVEAFLARGFLTVEARIKPLSLAFSELSVKVRMYPGSLQEALDMRYPLLLLGLQVEGLLPVLVASALEERLFNCQVPDILASLVEQVERVIKRF